MNRLFRILNFSLTSTSIDLWLLRVASWSVGVGVLVLVALALPRHAANATELSLGLGLAVLNCLISVMYGGLSHRVQSAALRMKIPWRVRMWEWCSYALGSAILILGMWFTSTLPLGRAGFISAFLLIFAMTLATFSVGLLFTLSRGDFSRTVPSSSSETTAPRS